MSSVRKYLWLSQISQVVFLLICLVIMPKVLTSGGGASDFGDHVTTVVPYILGFALCAIFLWLAAAQLLTINNDLRAKAFLFLVLAALELLVLLSTFPRHINSTYSGIHNYLGISLYTYEFAISVWLLKIRSRYWTVLFLLVQSVGSTIGLLSLVGVIHFLFIGQAIGAIGFGLLFVTVMPDAAYGANYLLLKPPASARPEPSQRN